MYQKNNANFCNRYLRVKKTGRKNNEQTEAHIYDEVGNYAKAGTVCKSQSTHSKDDNVIFEVSTSQMPAYQSLTKSLDDSYNKAKNEKSNDYYIEGEGNLKLENIYGEEEYIKTNCEKEMQDNHTYNKLMHLKQ